MGYAQYIGRIGALAVALGVTSAVAHPQFALAEEPTASGSADTGAANTDTTPPSGPADKVDTSAQDDATEPSGSDQDADTPQSPTEPSDGGDEADSPSTAEPAAEDATSAEADDQDATQVEPTTTTHADTDTEAVAPRRETTDRSPAQAPDDVEPSSPAADDDLPFTTRALSVAGLDDESLDSPLPIEPVVPLAKTLSTPLDGSADTAAVPEVAEVPPLESLALGVLGVLGGAALDPTGTTDEALLAAAWALYRRQESSADAEDAIDEPAEVPEIGLGIEAAAFALLSAPANEAPTAVNDTKAMTQGVPRTFSPVELLSNDTDPERDALRVHSVADAVGGTAVLNADGTVTFTPAAGFSGAAAFTYTVEDAAGSVSADAATVTLNVRPNSAPIATDDTKLLVQNVSRTFTPGELTYNDIDLEHDAMRVHSVADAIGGSVVLNADGTVTFTPETDYNGPASFAYRVKDVYGLVGSNPATVNLTVRANTAPTAGDDAKLVVQNVPRTLAPDELTYNDTDPEGDARSIHSVDNAVGGTVVLNADGTVTFTPETDYNGPASFTYQAKDSYDLAGNSATVAITVRPNTAPTAGDDTKLLVENVSRTFAPDELTYNDTDPEHDWRILHSVDNAVGGTVVLNADGTVTFTPENDYTGAASFTYQVRDTYGLVSNSATVALTVRPNTAPTPGDDAKIMVEDTPRTFVAGELTYNDTDAEHDARSIHSVTGATGGTAVLNADGTVTFTPETDYNGLASFTYKIQDAYGAVSATSATVNLTVLPVDDAPVALRDNASTTEETPVTINVLSNDADIDSSSLTVASLTQGANGTTTLNSDGTITYTPAPNYSGADTFTYRVTDGHGVSKEATVTVTVNPVNDKPVAGSPAFTMTSDPRTGVVTGQVHVADPDPGDALAFTLETALGPESGSVTVNSTTGAFTYTPSELARLHAWESDGEELATFVVKASDGQLDATVQVKVPIAPLAPNSPPEAGNPAFSVVRIDQSDGSVTGQIHASDDDSFDTLTYRLDSPIDPSVGVVVVDSASGAFTFTPTASERENAWTAADNRAVTFNVIASDGKESTTIDLEVPIAPRHPGSAPTVATPAFTVSSIDAAGVVTGRVNVFSVDTLTFSVGTQVSSIIGAVTVDPDTGEFTFTPTAQAMHEAWRTQTADSAEFTVTATGGGWVTEVAVTAAITPDNGAPYASSSTPYQIVSVNPATGVVDGRVVVFDPDGDSLTWSIGSPIDGAVGEVHIVSSTGYFTFTPTDASRAGASAGSDSVNFVVSVTDGEQTVEVSVVAPITPFNQAPIVGESAFTVTYVNPVTGNVTGTVNISDPDQGMLGTLNFQLSSNVDPTVGKVYLDSASGTFTFAPTAEARTGGVSAVTFTVAASDPLTSATVDVTVPILTASPSTADQYSDEIRGISGKYDKTELHGAAVAGNGMIYQTVSRWDPVGGIYVTAVAVIRPDGTTTTYDAMGEPVGSVILGSDGTAYQAISFRTGDVARSGLLVVTPSGDSSFSGYTLGEVVGAPLITSDGTAYLTLAGSRSNGIDAAVVTVTKTGSTRVDTVSGVASGGVVVGPDRTLYLTTVRYGLYGAITGTVSVLSPDSVTSFDLPGEPIGSVLLGADGEAYQLFRTHVGDGPGVALAVVSADGVRTVSGSVRGQPVGQATRTPDGALYQTVEYRNSVRVMSLNSNGFQDYSGPINGVAAGGVVAAADGTLYQAVSYFEQATGQYSAHIAVVTAGSVVYSEPVPTNSTLSMLLAADGTAFLTTYISDASAGDVTHVTIYPSEGGSTDVQIAGSPTGSSVLSSDGTMYQVTSAWDPATYTNTTLVARITVGGSSLAVLDGSLAGNLVLGLDGTAYVTTSSGWSNAPGTRIAVIDSAGTTTFTIDNPATDPITITPVGSIVIGVDGTAFQTFAVHRQDAEYTVVTTVSRNGFTVVMAETPGFAGGSVEIGPNGTVYQTVTRVLSTGKPITSVYLVGGQHEVNSIPQADVPACTIDSIDRATGLVTGTVQVNDADGDRLSFTLTDSINPSIGTVSLDSASGVFTFTPSSNAREDAWSTSDLDSATFSVTAADGQSSIQFAVSVPIVPVNHVPETGDPGFNFTTDLDNGVVTGAVNVTDVDPQDTLTYSLTAGVDPTVATVELDPETGQFTITPTIATREQAYTSTRSTVSITIRVDDSVAAVDVNVTVPILPQVPVNDPPTITGSGYSIDNADTQTGVVSGSVSFTDPDGDALTYQLVTDIDPALGTAIVNSTTGVWVFQATGQARLDAVSSNGVQEVIFSIVATDGEYTARVDVHTPIVPAIDYAESSLIAGTQPLGVAIGTNGRLYVTNYSGGTVTVLEPGGALADTIDVSAVNGVSTTAYLAAAGPDGRIYLTLWAFNNTGPSMVIAAIDPAAGNAVSVIADMGQRYISSLAVDNQGRIYAYDQSTRTITRFNTSENSSETIEVGDLFGVGNGALVNALATGADGRLYVAATGAQSSAVFVLDTDGAVEHSFAVRTPSALAVGADGRVIVASSDGRLTTYVSDIAVGEITGVSSVNQLVVDSAGRIFTTDYAGNRVIVFTPMARETPPYEFTVDDDTGAVSGRINVFASGAGLVYALDSNVDPALGRVLVDPQTGWWVFTPTTQARLAALGTPETDTVEFSVTATDGDHQTIVQIVAPIAPATTNFDITTDVITGVGSTPAGIAIDGDGRLYVANFYGGTITIRNADGTFEPTIQFDGSPFAIAIGPDGRLYVSDVNAGRVSVIDPTNNYETHIFATLSSPTGLAFDQAGHLYVASAASTTVTIINADGTAATPLYVGGPTGGVAVSSDGTVYATLFTNRVLIVRPDGSTRAIELDGSGFALAVGNDGLVYVAHSDNGAVDVIDPTTGNITQVAATGRPSAGIALDADGRIYVSDLNDGTVRVLSLTVSTSTAPPVPAFDTAISGFPGDPSSYEFVGPVAGPNGVVYQAITEMCSDGDPYTRILAFGQTSSTAVPGVAYGSVVFGTDGTAYQAVFDYYSYSTRVVQLSPEGDSLVTEAVPGAPASEILAATDGTAYLSIANYPSTTVLVLRPSGHTTQTVDGGPQNIVGLSTNLVVIGDTAYQVTGSLSTEPLTTIAAVNSNGMTVHQITGIAGGSPVAGPDGTIYLPIATLSADRKTITTRVATFTTDGETQSGDPIVGIPMGSPILSASGVMYQVIAAPATSGTQWQASVVEFGPTGFGASSVATPIVMSGSSWTAPTSADDGTVFQLISGTSGLSVAVIAPSGNVSVQTVAGANSSWTPLVAGTNGSAVVSSVEQDTTTISVITASGITSYQFSGSPESMRTGGLQSPVIAPNGSVYQVLSPADTTTGASRIAVITADGPQTTYTVTGTASDLTAIGNRVFLSITTYDSETGSYTTTPAMITSTGVVAIASTVAGMPAGAIIVTPTGQLVETVAGTAADDAVGGATTVRVIGMLTDFNTAPDAADTPFTSNTDPATGVVTGAVDVTDPDGDTVLYSLTAPVDSSVGIVNLDPHSGTWTFVPTVAARHLAAISGGSVEFSINAFDGAANTVVPVTIDIVPLDLSNHAPLATSDVGSITFDHATAGSTGTVHTVDVDGDTVTFSVATQPDSGLGTASIDPQTGVWTFVPARDALIKAWATAEDVVVQFTVSASDGQAETPVVITTVIRDTAEALAAVLERTGSRPAGVAVGSDGTVYVIDSGASTLTVFDPSDWSSTVTPVGTAPSAIAIGLYGTVWITNSGDNTVTITDRNGSIVGGGTVGVSPTGIAIDRFGRAFVVNSGDGTVSVLGPSGATQPGSSITVGGSPQGIAIGADGRLYVTNLATGGITVIDPDHDYAIRTIENVAENPYGVAVRPNGSLYVTDPFAGTVTILTPSEDDYTRQVIDVDGAPSAITVGSDGRIYLTNSSSASVTILNPETLTMTLITVGDNPIGVTTDAQGNIYVGNGGSGTISVVHPNGGEPTGRSLASGPTTETVDLGSKPYSVTVGTNNVLIVIDNHTNALTVVPAHAGAPLSLDVSTTRWSLGTPWAIGPNAISYYLKDTSFIFPETSLIAYGADGHQISSSTVAFLYDRYPYGQVVAADGRVYYLLQSFNPYVDQGAGQDETYVMMVDPMNPGGLHYMYETLDRVNDPRPDDLRDASIGPDGRVYVLSDQYVLVFDPDGSPWGARIPVSISGYLGMVVGPDGRIYVRSLSGTDPMLEVIDPATQDNTIIELPHEAPVLAVADDGRVYMSGFTGSTLTVLAPDLSVDIVLDIGFSPSQIVVGPNGYVVIPTANGFVVINPSDNYSMTSVDLGGSTQIVPDPQGNGAIYLSTTSASGTSLTRLSLPGAFSALEDPVKSPTDLLADLIEWAKDHPVPTEATLAKDLTEFLTDYVYKYAKMVGDLAKQQHIKALFDGLPSGMKDATLDYITKLADGEIRIPPSTIDKIVKAMKVVYSVGSKVVSLVSAPFNVISAWMDSNNAKTESDKTHAAIATVAGWAPFFTAAIGFVVGGPPGLAGGWAVGSAFGFGLGIGNEISKVVEDALTPAPPTPDPPQFSTSPSTMADLYTRLREVTADTAEGVYIETVLDDEGHDPRLIVYLGGTNPANWVSGNQAILENTAYFGQIKDEQTRTIDAALAKAPGARIMLVGYSQGGMDAQNIAASGRYNVTTVVTFGSPIIKPPSTTYRTIHLWAENDRVTDFTFRKYASYYDAALDAGQLFVDSSTTHDDGWFNIHADGGTYREIGQKFDNSPSGNLKKFWPVKNNIQQFLNEPVLEIDEGSVFVDGMIVPQF